MPRIAYNERQMASKPLTLYFTALLVASPKDSEIYRIGVASYASMLLL